MKALEILLAEDSELDAFLVEQALTQHQIPHHLHIVDDGGLALQYLRDMGKNSDTPCLDLMLLDLNLPSAGGPEILNALRKHPTCPGMPVIVVTSSDAARDRAEVAKLGISCYFRKPIDLDSFMELGKIVRDVIANDISDEN
jgi:CheY-like chemotaxis protein